MADEDTSCPNCCEDDGQDLFHCAECGLEICEICASNAMCEQCDLDAVTDD